MIICGIVPIKSTTKQQEHDEMIKVVSQLKIEFNNKVTIDVLEKEKMVIYHKFYN